MTAESPGRRKLAKLVSNHILRYKYRYKLLAGMNGEGVSYKIRSNR